MSSPQSHRLRLVCWKFAAFALCSPLSGCLVVGGYRRGGGFFIWPGSIGLFIVLLVVFLMLRRR